jgi:anti-sigma regulatory factor (Ser/Thr protein kinase)
MAQAFERTWSVMGLDFTSAGRASTGIKDALKQVGVDPSVVRRVATASYEAEMNVVMHARKGNITLRVSPAAVVVEAADEGPGIPDLELAMQEGYSTATPEMREMGFGAGMGLSNMKKNADDLDIETVVGRGTLVRITVRHLREGS